MTYDFGTWNPQDIVSCKNALTRIYTQLGADAAQQAVLECDFGNLNTDAVIEELNHQS